MKLFKVLAFGLLAASGISVASAQTTIVITGSSAYRSNVNTAILNIMTGTTYAYYNTGTTGLNGANAAIFRGTIASQNVVIKTSWSGSAAGIQTVAATSPTKTVGVFVDAQTTSAAPGTLVNSGGDPRTSGTSNNVNTRPDIAMADNTQSSTLFNGTYLGVVYNALSSAITGPVGVVPFQWVASESSASYGTLNMTSQVAQSLYAAGVTPLSQLTGNSVDNAVAIVAVGRDPDSGTRIVAFAESGVGISSTVTQYLPTVSSGAVTALGTYAPTTINGVPVVAGNSGENSGGNLATFLGATGPSAAQINGTVGPGITATAGFMVGYVGTSDASTAITNGAVAMNYNGVPYSVANVQNGSYTFWGYERMYFRSTAVAPVTTVAAAIANEIKTNTAAVTLASMRASRALDGGVVNTIGY